jgi:hypothetical protein
VKPSVFALLVLFSGIAFADNEAPLLRVGEQSLSVTAARELLRWLPQTERRADVAETIDKVLARQLLFAQRGANVLGKSARYHDVVDGLLVDALERHLHGETQVPADSVAAYYNAHPDEFTLKQALLLSRILVESESVAAQLIAQVSTRDGVKKWNALTREHSLDEATKWREGSLGFVRQDGTTDVPQVRVNPVLYAAAAALHDGEVASKPVAEGKFFAVVWRRAVREAQTTTLETAAPRILALLERQALQAQFKALSAELRQKYVTAYAPDALEAIAYPDEPGIPLPKVPLTPHPAAVPGAPSAGERGER